MYIFYTWGHSPITQTQPSKSEHYHQPISNLQTPFRLLWFFGQIPYCCFLSFCVTLVLLNTVTPLLGTARQVKTRCSVLNVWSRILISKDCAHSVAHSFVKMCGVCVCVCVCKTEKERARGKEHLHIQPNRRTEKPCKIMGAVTNTHAVHIFIRNFLAHIFWYKCILFYWKRKEYQKTFQL